MKFASFHSYNRPWETTWLYCSDTCFTQAIQSNHSIATYLSSWLVPNVENRKKSDIARRKPTTIRGLLTDRPTTAGTVWYLHYNLESSKAGAWRDLTPVQIRRWFGTPLHLSCFCLNEGCLSTCKPDKKHLSPTSLARCLLFHSEIHKLLMTFDLCFLQPQAQLAIMDQVLLLDDSSDDEF